jgi:hypothetical protein
MERAKPATFFAFGDIFCFLNFCQKRQFLLNGIRECVSRKNSHESSFAQARNVL